MRSRAADRSNRRGLRWLLGRDIVRRRRTEFNQAIGADIGNIEVGTKPLKHGDAGTHIVPSRLLVAPQAIGAVAARLIRRAGDVDTTRIIGREVPLKLVLTDQEVEQAVVVDVSTSKPQRDGVGVQKKRPSPVPL